MGGPPMIPANSQAQRGPFGAGFNDRVIFGPFAFAGTSIFWLREMAGYQT
jgi:hypothetical protein